MELYVEFDASLKETAICAVDCDGMIVAEGMVMSQPEAIACILADEVAEYGLTLMELIMRYHARRST